MRMRRASEAVESHCLTMGDINLQVLSLIVKMIAPTIAVETDGTVFFVDHSDSILAIG